MKVCVTSRPLCKTPLLPHLGACQVNTPVPIPSLHPETPSLNAQYKE